MKRKYGNKKTTLYGITFDSKAEAERYFVLRADEKAGKIALLKLQEVFELAPSVYVQGRKRPPLRYKADFVYLRDNLWVVEDVKGVITEVYRIKRHLMKSVLGVDIVEIK